MKLIAHYRWALLDAYRRQSESEFDCMDEMRPPRHCPDWLQADFETAMGAASSVRADGDTATGASRLRDPVDASRPGVTVHGIEALAIPGRPEDGQWEASRRPGAGQAVGGESGLPTGYPDGAWWSNAAGTPGAPSWLIRLVVDVMGIGDPGLVHRFQMARPDPAAEGVAGAARPSLLRSGEIAESVMLDDGTADGTVVAEVHRAEQKSNLFNQTVQDAAEKADGVTEFIEITHVQNALNASFVQNFKTAFPQIGRSVTDAWIGTVVAAAYPSQASHRPDRPAFHRGSKTETVGLERWRD